MKIKKFFKVIFLVLIISAMVQFTILAVMIYAFGIPRKYVTTSTEDYGNYIGNNNNKYVQSFIQSFFPPEIEDCFSDIEYSYRAQKNDAYAFEAYLAFTVEDKAVYDSIVESYTAGLEHCVFRYDSTYQEYTIVDEFVPSKNRYSENYVNISRAHIGKILCCPERQEIIFIALGVYDGGIARTDFLTVYFSRFNIDPIEYAEHAIPSYMK